MKYVIRKSMVTMAYSTVILAVGVISFIYLLSIPGARAQSGADITGYADNVASYRLSGVVSFRTSMPAGENRPATTGKPVSTLLRDAW